MQSELSACIESVYLIGEELGRGRYGVIRLCTNKSNGQQMACKTIPKDSHGKAQNEVQIMQKLSGHINVVNLHAVYEEKDCFHLVMEFCSGGSLLDLINGELLQKESCSEHDTAKLIKALVTAIKYCHKMEVVHRDIKPENILVTSDGQLKLADFGLSLCCPKGGRLSGVVGTLSYIAPETLLGTYTAKVDIWAAGVIFHALLVGMLPFRGSPQDIVKEIQHYKQLNFHAAEWKSVSGPAKDLLSCMLCRDVEKRLSASEIIRHPWIIFHTDYAKNPGKDHQRISCQERFVEMLKNGIQLLRLDDTPLDNILYSLY